MSTCLRKVGEYVIRECTIKDIPNVIQINLEMLPEHYSEQFFYTMLETNRKTFLAGELNGRVIGYAMGRVEYGFTHDIMHPLVKKGHVVSLAVLKEHQRKGVGMALMEELIKRFRERDCYESFLEVRVSNLPAILLYKKLGYQITSRLERYYLDGEDGYLMTMKL